MLEIILLEDLIIKYETPVEQAFLENGFDPFRVDPYFLKGAKFPPHFKGEEGIKAHFLKIPTVQEVKDIPIALKERIIRTPKDIREVTALGQVLKGDHVDHWIYAPSITSAEEQFIRIVRYPEWKGFGCFLRRSPDDRNLRDLPMIGFSNT